MREWTTYTKTKNGDGSSENSDKPKIIEYILIKLTDNFLTIAVFILCILFGTLGLFYIKADSNITWALHASELSLGVFLGLAKRK
ncbi:hypothetical protein ACXR6G_02310 [Ancylomarina sp. YFZ004]